MLDIMRTDLHQFSIKGVLQCFSLFYFVLSKKKLAEIHLVPLLIKWNFFMTFEKILNGQSLAKHYRKHFCEKSNFNSKRRAMFHVLCIQIENFFIFIREDNTEAQSYLPQNVKTQPNCSIMELISREQHN